MNCFFGRVSSEVWLVEAAHAGGGVSHLGIPSSSLVPLHEIVHLLLQVEIMVYSIVYNRAAYISLPCCK